MKHKAWIKDRRIIKENSDISLSSCKQKIEWLEGVNKDLLEACKQLLDRLTYHGSIDSIREEGSIEDLRQAIAKAEGKE